MPGFIAELDTAFLATVSAEGAPYIQHRGGPKGFIKVLDDKTLGFADFAGNKQYITISNLAGNDRAYLFLLDFANRQRIKVWGRARVVENDPALMERLVDPGYRARPERAILFTIEAWDVNCSQHITERYTQGEIAVRGGRIARADRGAGGRKCAAAQPGRTAGRARNKRQAACPPAKADRSVAGKICNLSRYRTVLLSQLASAPNPGVGRCFAAALLCLRVQQTPLTMSSTARCWRAAREKAALNSGSPWAAAPNGAEERGWCAGVRLRRAP